MPASSQPKHILVVCSGNTCRSVTLMFLLRQALAHRGASYVVHSRATREKTQERMSEFAIRALVRAARLVEMSRASSSVNTASVNTVSVTPVRDIQLGAEGHVSRSITTLGSKIDPDFVFSMQRSHAESVNHWLEAQGKNVLPIVGWHDWAGASGGIVVLDVPDDAWELRSARGIERLEQDVDRAVSFEYDRQAEVLSYYASQIGMRVP